MSVRKIAVKDALKFLDDDSSLELFNRRTGSDRFMCELYDPDRLDAARHRLQHIRGETRCDGFILGKCDKSFIVSEKLKRKTRLESPIVPHAYGSRTPFGGTTLKTANDMEYQHTISISDDEMVEESEVLEETTLEEKIVKPKLEDEDTCDFENTTLGEKTTMPEFHNLNFHNFENTILGEKTAMPEFHDTTSHNFENTTLKEKTTMPELRDVNSHESTSLQEDSAKPVLKVVDFTASGNIPLEEKIERPNSNNTDFLDLKSTPLEEDTAKPVLKVVDFSASETTEPSTEKAMWIDAPTSCHVLENEDSRSDKENNGQQLKVVAPSFLEKQNFSIESEFSGKVYVTSPKPQLRPEVSGCQGDLRLKRPRLLSSTTPLCRSPAPFATRKLSLLEESIRLDEREKYSELLQSFTRVPVMRQTVNSTRRERSPPVSLISHSRKRGINKIELIDLTVQQNEPRVDIRRPSTTFEKFGSTASGLREHLPSSELRKKLDKCNVYDVSWIEELSKMYNRKDRENRRKIMEEKTKAALCTKQSEQLLNEILEEKVRVHLRLTEVAVEEGPVPIAEDEEPLPELSPEMEKRVAYAFKSGPGGELMVEAFSMRITRRDMQTLSKLNWLNDEVINFYMNLLIERGKRDNYPSVHCFNTFFYPKLKAQGHSSLKRWTKKIDIFANELLIVPVHLGVHWCLSCINLKEKKILYFDSMGGDNNTCLQTLFRYLQDECMDKKKVKFDTTGWSLENVKDNPQQMNGSDCGMFSCMYAEYLCRRAKITFSQKDMPYFRRKMAYEILTKKLLL